MLDMLRKIFNKEASGQIARDRLKVVLIHDRANVSPEILENIRQDIVAVISKYVEIDSTGMEFALENDNNSVALVANIPVTKLKHGK